MKKARIQEREKGLVAADAAWWGPRGLVSSLPQTGFRPRTTDEIAEAVNFVAFRVPSRSLFSPSISTAHAAPGSSWRCFASTRKGVRAMGGFRDVYSKITNRIAADLEQGVRPWMRPWSVDHAAGKITRPLRHNFIPYKGINVVMLWSASVMKGYACPLWPTVK
jgi:hypothetical protein